MLKQKTTVTIIALLMGSAALAGDTHDQDSQHGPAEKIATFQDLDLDRDGNISTQEFAELQAPRKSFAELDKDGNGGISEQEYRTMPMGPKPGKGPANKTVPATPATPGNK
jgi:hypothetical protein